MKLTDLYFAIGQVYEVGEGFEAASNPEVMIRTAGGDSEIAGAEMESGKLIIYSDRSQAEGVA